MSLDELKKAMDNFLEDGEKDKADELLKQTHELTN